MSEGRRKEERERENGMQSFSDLYDTCKALLEFQIYLRWWRLNSFLECVYVFTKCLV